MVACDGKPCDPGQESFWGQTSQKKCENCAVGTFAALPGSSECTYPSLHILIRILSRSLRTFCMSSTFPSSSSASEGLVCGNNAVAPIKSASCTECVDGRVPVASAACNFPGGALVCGIGYRADPTRCDRPFLPPLSRFSPGLTPLSTVPRSPSKASLPTAHRAKRGSSLPRSRPLRRVWIAVWAISHRCVVNHSATNASRST